MTDNLSYHEALAAVRRDKHVLISQLRGGRTTMGKSGMLFGFKGGRLTSVDTAPLRSARSVAGELVLGGKAIRPLTIHSKYKTRNREIAILVANRYHMSRE